ncbi:MAG: hypothetical protein ACOC33_02525 [bacterium]
MIEFLRFLNGIVSNDTMSTIIDWIIRVLVLTFFGIGIRYTIKSIIPKIKENILTIITTISILLGSITITYLYHTSDIILQNIWEFIIFWLISNGLYQMVGKDICKRLDNFLDRKFGKN